jgi:hypothetical protein
VRRREKVLLLASFLFTAICTGAGLAHLYEFPNKIQLSVGAYLTVQQIYRGWASFGIAFIASIVLNLALTILLRKTGPALLFAAFAFVCMLGAQALFWSFTFPVNQQTNNWTVLPANWLQSRDRWELSHAAAAVLDFAALTSLMLAALAGGDSRSR